MSGLVNCRAVMSNHLFGLARCDCLESKGREFSPAMDGHPCMNKVLAQPRVSETGHSPKARSFAALITAMLGYLQEDPDREGLRDTPQRVAAAWAEWTAGYAVDPVALLKTFEDGAEGCDEMVVSKDVPFYSHCEHHMAPFFGTATVAYVPRKRIVGLSKINRLVDAFARRLQVQERMTNQIASTLWEVLEPIGVGVIVKARHMCVESRGIKQPGSITITSALRGAMKDDARARAEFLILARE